MNDFFLDLIRYNKEANSLLIDALLKNQNVVTERCSGLMSHVLNVHQIWNKKILAGKETLDPWKSHFIVDLELMNEENFEDSIKILNEYDLDKIIRYSTRSGKVFINTISEILFQAINHSTYHRGQIATEFRNIGIDPKLTDYILFRMKPLL